MGLTLVGLVEQKIFPAKNGGHVKFLKNAFISLTVRDRAILSKYLTHRVLERFIWSNSQKKFLSIFKKCLYFLNGQRYNDFVEIFSSLYYQILKKHINRYTTIYSDFVLIQAAYPR